VAEENRQEQDDVQEETSNTLGWFLAGAVIGAAVAILYAPKSGKETRQFIADTTQKGKEAVVDSSQSVLDAGRDMFERGRKLVEDAADLFDRGRRLVRG
jgi:gas vesicle protein